MDEPEFFRRSGPFSLIYLAEAVNAQLSGDDGRLIYGIASIAFAQAGDIIFLEDRKRRATLAQSKAGACLVKRGERDSVPAGMAALVVDEPARARAVITGLFYPYALSPGRLAGEGAVRGQVDPSAQLEPGVVVERGAIIGPGAQIGGDSIIAPGALIGPGVRIGRNCYIGPNSVIQHALVGNHVIIHGGCYVGQDGFGYVMGRQGHTKIPQIGRVIIQDKVEIGAGTTIDRGALDDTIIGEGTKIDNQVQIGHNVVIGRHCIIVAKVGISGSCRLGDFVAVGGGAGLADHLTIGAGARIGAAAGVMHDVPAGETWLGAPAKPMKMFFREVAVLSKLAADGKGGKARGGEGEKNDD